ncbi:hypothetical protein Tco_0462463 [Tanacetum coccineum]
MMFPLAQSQRALAVEEEAGNFVLIDPTAYVRPVAHAIASYMSGAGVRVLRNVKRKLQEVIQQKKTDASVPSTELAKEVVDTVSSPKFDFATDLFDMLSMSNGPTDKVLVAASYADALWAGFQCESSLIPSSSRCSTILGYVANLFAIFSFYSARSIMVKFALVDCG